VLDSLFAQPLSNSSLVYLLVLHFVLHAFLHPDTQSLSFFTTHAHTIATCFAVVPRLCHLFLVCLSSPSLSLNSTWNYLNVTRPSLLTEVPPHFFLTGQVSLLCNILLRTQLLYSLPLRWHIKSGKYVLYANICSLLVLCV